MIVTTTKGDMDDSLLEKREGSVDNDNVTAGTFSLSMPTNDSTNALICIA